MLTYRVEYRAPGRGTVTAAYESAQPLQPGQWIAVGAVYLVVERVVAGKRGDAYAGIALCKLAQG
jgi:hypothetical protein